MKSVITGVGCIYPLNCTTTFPCNSVGSSAQLFDLKCHVTPSHVTTLYSYITRCWFYFQMKLLTTLLLLCVGFQGRVSLFSTLCEGVCQHVAGKVKNVLKQCRFIKIEPTMTNNIFVTLRTEISSICQSK